MSPQIKTRVSGAWVDIGGPTHAKISGSFESLVTPSTVNTLSLPGTAGNYVSTPDAGSNSVEFNLDIRAHLKPTTWTDFGFIVAKWDSPNNSYRFDIAGGGALQFLANVGGTQVAGSAAVPFATGEDGWVRVTRFWSTGAVTFYTSTDGTTWTQLGSPVTTATGGMFDGTSPLMIGSSSGGAGTYSGLIYYVQVIGHNDVIAHTFDAAAVTKVGTRDPSTVAAGGPWTINGSAWDWAAG